MSYTLPALPMMPPNLTMPPNLFLFLWLATDEEVLLLEIRPSVSVDSELFCDDRLPVGDLPVDEFDSPLVMAAEQVGRSWSERRQVLGHSSPSGVIPS